MSSYIIENSNRELYIGGSEELYPHVIFIINQSEMDNVTISLDILSFGQSNMRDWCLLECPICFP